jgi:nucleotide-binding universal stress UspA family protein
MKTILGTDGSAHARIAEEVLLRLPAAHKGRLFAVAVNVPVHLPFVPVQPVGAAAIAEEFGHIMEEGRKHAKDAADQCAARLRSEGIEAEPVVLEGDPGNAILDFCEREGANLLAIGSKGQNALVGFILGSVARKLVAHAPCTVLIGRPYKGNDVSKSAATLAGKKKLSAVVAVDGSDGASAALDFVESCGNGAFEKLGVVCAQPLSVVPAGVDPGSLGQVYGYDRELAKSVVEHAAEKLSKLGPGVSTCTEVGRPGNVIMEFAESQGADLIVLGATRHGALERFLLGSVSYEVATCAPCSVLVIRPSPG